MPDDQLQRQGVTRPFELADKTRLDKARDTILELKAQRRRQLQVAKQTNSEATPGTGQRSDSVRNPLLDRHMDLDVIRDLLFDANVLSAVADNLGRDLFLWRSNFFVKSEGTGENKWHHDRHFESGASPIDIYNTNNHFTILMALTDIGTDAGRIEYLSGSHLPVAGFDRDIPRHFLEAPDVVKDRITPLLLKKGQFVLFHSSLLHRSLAFGTGDGRISMVGRLARKGTEIPEYGCPNPAGGAQTEAEPIIYYRPSGILPYN